MAGPKSTPHRPYVKNILNCRFGRLVAVALEPISPSQRACWRCQCDCGALVVVRGKDLRSGNTTSCGCLKRDRSRERATTHGYKGTLTYSIWCNMLGRCDNTHLPRYKDYGGRGITYDPHWKSFENFLADMGEAPPGLELDRRDNDGNYCKANCRWVTTMVNCNNTRRNKHYDFRGQSYTLRQLSDLSGISYKALSSRMLLGWSVERAVTEPLFTSPFAHPYSRR